MAGAPLSSRAHTPPATEVKDPSSSPPEEASFPLISGVQSESNATASLPAESAATISEPARSNQMQTPSTSAEDSHADANADADTDAKAPTGLTESVDLEAEPSSAPLPQESPAVPPLASASTGSHAGAQPNATSARGARAGRACDHELEQSDEGRVRRLLKTRALFNTLERLDARQHATLLRERQRVQKCLIHFNSFMCVFYDFHVFT